MRKFTQDNEARRRSRQQIGTVPKVKVIPDKRRRPPKHKRPIDEQS